jgi:16S rRNA (cytosine1402-N4)-methyltransferase
MRTPVRSPISGSEDAYHEPVLLAEVLAALEPGRGGLFVDCTVGLGGHARGLLQHGASRVVGFDRDPDALAITRENLAGFGERVTLVHADFRSLVSSLKALAVDVIAGLVADLGVSSMQLQAPGRGFSFRKDEPLDMRMDRSSGPTAADLLRDASEQEIADAIFAFGEERHSRRVARAIVAARGRGPLATTGELADVVRRAIPHRGYQRIDPATRTFQGLRIWVNRELEGLDGFVRDAMRVLSPGGRAAIISFHSLEDRVVKHTMRELEHDGRVRLLTRKPVIPADEELSRNPRARSAKLRAAERLA